MIIRGGQNIYPPEIEGLLNEHPAIASVSVIGIPDAEYGERSVAFVIPKKDATISLDQIKDFLIDRKVAKYKFPEYLEIIDTFPTVGDSGKINKAALRKEAGNRLNG